MYTCSSSDLNLYLKLLEPTIRLIDRSGASPVHVVDNHDTDDVPELPNSDTSGWARQDVRETRAIAQLREVIIIMSLFVSW